MGLMISDDFRSQMTDAASRPHIERLARARRLLPESAFSTKLGRIEEMQDPVKEFGGKVHLITDEFGAFTYTRDIKKVIEQYGKLLFEEGRAYLQFGGVGENLEILGKNGERILPVEFLREIRGFRVHVEDDRILLIRTLEPVYVPPLEVVTHIEGVPPRRTVRCPSCERREPVLEPISRRPMVSDNDFRVERGQTTYADSLRGKRGSQSGFGDFEQLRDSLGANDLWVDVGCGACKAALDFFGGRGINFGRPVTEAAMTAKNTPRFVGLNLSDDFDSAYRYSDAPQHSRARKAVSRFREFQANAPQGRAQVLTGRPIEDFKDPAREIGSAKLITDVYGAFAYSPHIDQVIERYAQMLAKDGTAFIHFDRAHPHARIVDEFGREIPILEYLKLAKGIRVAQEDDVIKIERTSGPITIPRLELLQFEHGPPVERVWRLPGHTVREY